LNHTKLTLVLPLVAILLRKAMVPIHRQSLMVLGNRPARVNYRGLTIAPLPAYKHASMAAPPMQDTGSTALTGFPVPMQVTVFTGGDGRRLDVKYCLGSISRI
jgi:hypothetical protein